MKHRSLHGGLSMTLAKKLAFTLILIVHALAWPTHFILEAGEVTTTALVASAYGFAMSAVTAFLVMQFFRTKAYLQCKREELMQIARANEMRHEFTP